MPGTQDADRWRRRAAEATELAQRMSDPDARRAMMLLAAEYTALAKAADSLADIRPPDGVAK